MVCQALFIVLLLQPAGAKMMETGELILVVEKEVRKKKKKNSTTLKLIAFIFISYQNIF